MMYRTEEHPYYYYTRPFGGGKCCYGYIRTSIRGSVKLVEGLMLTKPCFLSWGREGEGERERERGERERGERKRGRGSDERIFVIENIDLLLLSLILICPQML